MTLHVPHYADPLSHAHAQYCTLTHLPACYPFSNRHDVATELGVQGQGWAADEFEAPFNRFPRKAEAIVSPAVWAKSQLSAGRYHACTLARAQLCNL